LYMYIAVSRSAWMILLPWTMLIIALYITTMLLFSTTWSSTRLH